MALHQFTLEADWPGGRNEVGTITASNLQTAISIPPEMDGPGIGTNPDEMLLGAAATCYLISAAAMIERADLPLQHISLRSIGEVDVTKGVFTYKRIIHQPVVILKQEATTRQLRQLEKIINQAEASCMISRALRGNVNIELEANLSIAREEDA
ncbi:OsmC family protein [Gracilibacillus alcaliphilus]|uniref:OsmC family protein n=1 Tax=Gracilibacillus alcaliphilus TaxID=1401441 RepID=UPI001956926E|nr:OsmC family protein [Gracilibacillus alcaliphilus]MBM7677258.1 peroxiredoxin-like protein [Gracilibacillus alcaliphilus]